MGDAPATALAQTFVDAGFRMGRLKTGTPPRLRLSTIDLSVCDEQYGDDPPKPFSFMNSRVSVQEQVALNPKPLISRFCFMNSRVSVQEQVALNPRP
jgi:tRNA U34 5-carboxymethylaminomethyl modifying enzyme MnmG/GidA